MPFKYQYKHVLFGYFRSIQLITGQINIETDKMINKLFRHRGLMGSSFIQIPRFLKYFAMGIE